jgi:hypothetical protein
MWLKNSLIWLQYFRVSTPFFDIFATKILIQKNMKFKTLLFALLISLFTTIQSSADEGMWIPMLLEQLNEKEMRDMGMRLTAKDIYDINNSSLKDAILLFGGGCTAEIISAEGLILTNHHCGYREIQSHSTIQHDYLRDGFWAQNHNEELPSASLSVSRLVRMEDVTVKMLEGIKPEMTEKVRDSVLKINRKSIEAAASKENTYEAKVRDFYYGNEFYLFVTEVFKDVRLVGAPPSSIGKFGGDTDNWMWPRHTGDFSLFRIYVDKDNKPAAFSKENIPYKPLYTIPISLKGVKENDFTFIFGFPGRTQEYLPSDAIEMITQVQNPIRIELRRQKLDIYESFMSQDQKVRIQYSAKDAGLSNGWKKWIGESKGIAKLDGIEKKQDYEQAFQKWVSSNTATKNQYGGLIDDFDKTFKTLSDFQQQLIFVTEAGFGIEIVRAARTLSRLEEISRNKEVSKDEIQKEIVKAKSSLSQFYKDYYLPLDKKIFVKMLESYRSGLDKSQLPEVFALIEKEYKGNIQAYADAVFEKSIFTDSTKVMAFLKAYKPSQHKKISKDPAFLLASGLGDHFLKNISPQVNILEARVDSMMRLYMKAQMEMQPDNRFYPDANSTLRVAYGKVKPYYPKDAVFYEFQTTLEGIIEKDDPAVYDYVVDERLKKLYASKAYGKYGQDGTMPVCFIGTNHTTGGNSGSPALNADGQLIGLNFDRCWEGTMSDLMYDADQCRNIMLDIRYFLFIVDKFAGAHHLIEEMVLVE